ncbi:MAG: WYL domain-containing protein [Chitinispirillaceae bacterium]|nr:WYL domain-containing protein [Chitinispirillaceae bacterium]
MNKWEKIVILHRLLSDSRYPVSLEIILQELECSQATFYRIRNFMRWYLNAPLEFSYKYNGYYYKKDDDGSCFELPGLWFTTNELEALFCLDYTLQNIEAGIFKEILEPLRKRIEPVLKAQGIKVKDFYNKIKIIPIHSRCFTNEIFRKLADGVIRKKTLKITHEKLYEGEPVTRIISPQTLVRYRDNWYVDAYCHLRKELRTFAVSRISAAEFVKSKFISVSHKEMEMFFASSYGIFTGIADKNAIINFYDIASKEVSTQKWHPKQNGKWISSTTYQLCLPYNHPEELIGDILRWGSKAELIEPLEVREKIKEEIRKMGERYK